MAQQKQFDDEWENGWHCDTCDYTNYTQHCACGRRYVPTHDKMGVQTTTSNLKYCEKHQQRYFFTSECPMCKADLFKSDVNICPSCGGLADNGHDREFPPNPYVCKTCTIKREAFMAGYYYRGTAAELGFEDFLTRADIPYGSFWEMTEHDPKVDAEGKYDPEGHHPDCAWWKWDQSFSWDSTNCTCDKVGAAKND